MGLFSDFCDWVREKVDDAKIWVEDKVENAIDTVRGFFDGLGNSGSYSGSVQETIDIDKVLNDFRDDISPEAKKLEEDYMARVTEKFDDFIKSQKCDYPELANALEQKKEEVRSKLSGIIINHINKRASVNDDEFRAILKMQPGGPKTEALKKQSQKFLSEAEERFKDRMQSEMGKLNDELSKRFREALGGQAERLKKKEEDYQEYLRDAERGQLDLKDIEDKRILAADACACMDLLFAQVEKER